MASDAGAGDGWNVASPSAEGFRHAIRRMLSVREHRDQVSSTPASSALRLYFRIILATAYCGLIRVQLRVSPTLGLKLGSFERMYSLFPDTQASR